MVAKRRFGRTGLEIPVVTYGGGWVGGLLIRADREVAFAALDRAFKAGIDWIDTAAAYGNGVSETVIGAWLKTLDVRFGPRISTKFNIDRAAGDWPGQVRRSLEASLERLGLDSVEVAILHNRVVGDGATDRGARDLTVTEVIGDGGIADILDGLRREGLIDWTGMTALGEPAAILDVVDSGQIDVAQVYYNALNPSAARDVGAGWNTTNFAGLVDRCLAQDMGLMGIRIFAAGHLAAKERHGREIAITENAEDCAEEARVRALDEVLDGQHGTPAQAALRFGLACDKLSTIVVGIGDPDHLEQVLGAIEMGPLDAAVVAEIAELWEAHAAFIG